MTRPKITKKYFAICHTGTANFSYSDGGWAIEEFDTLIGVFNFCAKNPGYLMCKALTVKQNLEEIG